MEAEILVLRSPKLTRVHRPFQQLKPLLRKEGFKFLDPSNSEFKGLVEAPQFAPLRFYMNQFVRACPKAFKYCHRQCFFSTAYVFYRSIFPSSSFFFLDKKKNFDLFSMTFLFSFQLQTGNKSRMNLYLKETFSGVQKWIQPLKRLRKPDFLTSQSLKKTNTLRNLQWNCRPFTRMEGTSTRNR